MVAAVGLNPTAPCGYTGSIPVSDTKSRRCGCDSRPGYNMENNLSSATQACLLNNAHREV